MSAETARKTEARILRVFRSHGGWLRQRDLVSQGFHPRWLSRLVDAGAVERVRKGLYRLTTAPSSGHQALTDAARAVPEGVICLVSALAFYELTNVNPPEVYVALDRKARVPRVSYPPIRFFRFSPSLLELGKKTVRLKGQTVQIFDEEKTLCDCIRHRHVVGQDVVLEATRGYLRRRRRDLEKLLEYSRVSHVQKWVRPYLEALV